MKNRIRFGKNYIKYNSAELYFFSRFVFCIKKYLKTHHLVLRVCVIDRKCNIISIRHYFGSKFDITPGSEFFRPRIVIKIMTMHSRSKNKIRPGQNKIQTPSPNSNSRTNSQIQTHKLQLQLTNSNSNSHTQTHKFKLN